MFLDVSPGQIWFQAHSALARGKKRKSIAKNSSISWTVFVCLLVLKVLHILAIEKPGAETKLFSQQKPPNSGSTCLLLWTSVLMFPNSTDTLLCSSLWWRPWLHTSLNMACSYHNPYKVIYLYNFDHSEQKNA